MSNAQKSKAAPTPDFWQVLFLTIDVGKNYLGVAVETAVLLYTLPGKVTNTMWHFRR
ncbi:MAG: hypothetical protein KJ069_02190 [Anaerolineae bacterium]|nr:hypothetical protein [Anaerolineae bacterium]